MTAKNHLVEQHILEYESRLKHIDELIEHVHDKVETADQSKTDSRSTLESIKEERYNLGQHLQELKEMRQHAEEPTDPADHITDRVGPLEIWDKVAEQLEKLAEHLDRK